MITHTARTGDYTKHQADLCTRDELWFHGHSYDGFAIPAEPMPCQHCQKHPCVCREQIKQRCDWIAFVFRLAQGHGHRKPFVNHQPQEHDKYCPCDECRARKDIAQMGTPENLPSYYRTHAICRQGGRYCFSPMLCNMGNKCRDSEDSHA